MPEISVGPLGDLAELGTRWRRLEASSQGGFFRGWTFLGCEAEARLAGASLLSVRVDGQDAVMALLGRNGSRLFLNETGDAVRDSIFIEHNGLLVRTGFGHLVIPALRAAIRAGRSLALSGIDDAHLAAARKAGWVRLARSRLAPAVDLAALQGAFIDTLSANARAQIRRAHRLYGPSLTLRRADGVAQALAFFDGMVELHQMRWRARGRPGAFAEPAVLAFHKALIARAVPSGEADLLEISAEGRAIGMLYTFLGGGRVASYQSGFAYGASARDKPGLVCHALAVDHYAARGERLYDLLGGADRYKTTLARGGETLHWAILRRRASPWGATEALLARLLRRPA